MADDFGYHIDHHGSLVRPARRCSPPGRRSAARRWPPRPDEAVVTLAHELRLADAQRLCDGQYRRSYLESVVQDQVAGFAPVTGPTPLAELAGIAAVAGPGGAGRRGRLGLGARAARRSRGRPVLATVDRTVFVTLPSPGYLAAAGSALASAADIDAVGRPARRSRPSCGMRSRRSPPRRDVRAAAKPAVRAAAHGGRPGRRGGGGHRRGRGARRADRGRPRRVRRA